jgi:hypothetical protein
VRKNQTRIILNKVRNAWVKFKMGEF